MTQQTQTHHQSDRAPKNLLLGGAIGLTVSAGALGFLGGNSTGRQKALTEAQSAVDTAMLGFQAEFVHYLLDQGPLETRRDLEFGNSIFANYLKIGAENHPNREAIKKFAENTLQHLHDSFKQNSFNRPDLARLASEQVPNTRYLKELIGNISKVLERDVRQEFKPHYDRLVDQIRQSSDWRDKFVEMRQSLFLCVSLDYCLEIQDPTLKELVSQKVERHVQEMVLEAKLGRGTWYVSHLEFEHVCNILDLLGPEAAAQKFVIAQRLQEALHEGLKQKDSVEDQRVIEGTISDIKNVFDLHPSPDLRKQIVLELAKTEGQYDLSRLSSTTNTVANLAAGLESDSEAKAAVDRYIQSVATNYRPETLFRLDLEAIENLQRLCTVFGGPQEADPRVKGLATAFAQSALRNLEQGRHFPSNTEDLVFFGIIQGGLDTSSSLEIADGYIAKFEGREKLSYTDRIAVAEVKSLAERLRQNVRVDFQ